MSKTYNGIFITATNNTIREFASDSPDSTIRVKKPTVIVGEYTFNNMPQGPTITWAEGMSKYCTITNATKVNAGNYILTIALKDTNSMVWEDLTDKELTYSYSIAKADQTITVSSNSINLNKNQLSATVVVSGNNTSLNAITSDDTVAVVSVDNSIITINNVNKNNGTAIITVTAISTDNYNAAMTTISVTTNFLSIVSFSSGTDTQIKDMLDAYYANEVTWEEMGWNIGDTRLIHLYAMDSPLPQDSGTRWATQDITVVIVAHDHTDLATAINGHTKACITVQTRECMNNCTSTSDSEGHIYVNGQRGSNMTFAKWSNLYMRTYLNTTVFDAFSIGDFKNAIKPSKHYRHTDYNTTAVEEVIDTLFLPSTPEVYGIISYTYYTNTSPTEGTQFPYYETQANRGKYGNNNGVPNSTPQSFWTGSASSYYSSRYGYDWLSAAEGKTPASTGGSDAGALAPAWAM